MYFYKIKIFTKPQVILLHYATNHRESRVVVKGRRELRDNGNYQKGTGRCTSRKKSPRKVEKEKKGRGEWGEGKMNNRGKGFFKDALVVSIEEGVCGELGRNGERVDNG